MKRSIFCKPNTIFSANRKIYSLYIKGNNIAKNSFLVEVTFKLDLLVYVVMTYINSVKSIFLSVDCLVSEYNLCVFL